MTTSIKGTQLRGLLLGTKIDKATAALPQTASQTLFTVAGGRIILTSIVGEVTTAIQAQATTAKISAAPTTGTAVDLCATTDLTGKEVGTLLGITGTFATGLVASNAGATVLPANGLVIPIGVIRYTTGASSTGSIKWTMTWIALDDGATVS